MLMYVILVFLLVALGVLTLMNIMANQDLAEREAAEFAAENLPATPLPTAEPTPTPEVIRNTEDILLSFAGDIVGQVGLTTQARVEIQAGDPAAGVEPVYDYDYYEQMQAVAPLVSGADVALCTLVSCLAEAESYDSYLMNPILAQNLADLGFDMVNTGTERLLDRELEGLGITVSALEEAGLVNLGTSAEESRFEENGGIATKVINGVTFAFLSYTAGTNGMSAADYPYAINILTTDYMSGQSSVDYDRLDTDLARAKEMGADVIVCQLYWWPTASYYTDVRDDQAAVADYLCAGGADIIIGSGTKVPQAIELKKVQRADGSYSDCVVAYSLGNLVSCLNDNYTNLSVVLDVELKRDVDNGEVWISHVSYRPLFMLDTDDQPDVSEAGYKYRLFDLYDTLERYDAVNTGEDGADPEALAADCITMGVYEAMKAGAESLQTIMGAEFDAVNGGVDVPAWSETVQIR